MGSHKGKVTTANPDDNPPVAGVVLGDAKGRYLLVQEKLAAAYGLWNLPAGWVDEGETLQQAAVREAREEVGFDVELIDHEPLLAVLNKSKNRWLNSFRARIVSGELVVSEEELLDAKWFTVQEIQKLYAAGKVRDPWVINSVIKSSS